VHLLYLDESGHPHDPGTQFFVLARFAVFERSTHWLESRINPIAARFSPQEPSAIEFHGSPMYSAKDDWAGVAPADRVQALVDILSLLSNRQLQLRVFASVIEFSDSLGRQRASVSHAVRARSTRHHADRSMGCGYSPALTPTAMKAGRGRQLHENSSE